MTQIHPDIFTVPGALSTAACEELIAQAEVLGFDAAPINTPLGAVRMDHVRNNERAMADDPELAARLFEAVRGSMPAHWRVREDVRDRPGASSVPSGLNERIRFYRYHPGHRFTMHRDGYFRRSEVEESRLTVLFFLNEGFEGGQTRFLTPEGNFAVTPQVGMALLFRHELMHEGAKVTQGVKYIARSDMMYRCVP